MSLLATGRYFESPRWHNERLWVTDGPLRRVLNLTLAGVAETVCEIDDIPGGLAFLPDGDLIIVGMFQRKLLRHRQGRVDLFADLTNVSGGTLDDMVVDGHGRAYVGDLGANLIKGEVKGAIGRIVLVTPDGYSRVVAEGLEFPNGLAISGDGKDLVVAESDGDRLSHFKIEADGSLRFVRRFGSFGEPDGVCFDREGCVWTALFKEDAFVRVDLEGRVLQRVSALGGRGVACVLGGAGRRTLFCLSAETTHQDLMRGKSSGRIDMVEVDVAGAGYP